MVTQIIYNSKVLTTLHSTGCIALSVTQSTIWPTIANTSTYTKTTLTAPLLMITRKIQLLHWWRSSWAWQCCSPAFNIRVYDAENPTPAHSKKSIDTNNRVFDLKPHFWIPVMKHIRLNLELLGCLLWSLYCSQWALGGLNTLDPHLHRTWYSSKQLADYHAKIQGFPWHCQDPWGSEGILKMCYSNICWPSTVCISLCCQFK